MIIEFLADCLEVLRLYNTGCPVKPQLVQKASELEVRIFTDNYTLLLPTNFAFFVSRLNQRSITIVSNND